MDPVSRYIELAQHLNQLVDIASGDEKGRASLQHGDMACLFRHGRNHGGGGRPGSDDHNALIFII